MFWFYFLAYASKTHSSTKKREDAVLKKNVKCTAVCKGKGTTVRNEKAEQSNVRWHETQQREENLSTAV